MSRTACCDILPFMRTDAAISGAGLYCFSASRDAS